MITSMTGFGRGAAEADGIQVRAELRSVNGRFLELQVRCANGLQEFEGAVRERLQARLTRGKVSAYLDWETGSAASELPVLNEPVLRRYLEELGRVRAIAGIAAEPDWSVLTRLPGLFGAEKLSADAEQAQALVEAAVDAALEDFLAMRAAEGGALEHDLRERVAAIESRLAQIEQLALGAGDRIRERLRDKLAALLEPGAVAEDRLAMEVALLAERSDITEEIVRFRSHNGQFIDTLTQGGDVGRRLNFLLQEMNREVNTISSKAGDAEVVHLAVEVKEEVERLREQVQNLA